MIAVNKTESLAKYLNVSLEELEKMPDDIFEDKFLDWWKGIMVTEYEGTED